MPKKLVLQFAALLFAGVFMSFILSEKKPIRVYLAGDSTMSIKNTKAYPETGWGMPFVYFFDSTVVVENLAANGRSTRTFIEEGRWKKITDNLSEGDYVFVQFGHNDEVPTKRSYTTEKEFKENLTRYVNETRQKKATPILITPVARRLFDSVGKVIDTHPVYAQIVRNTAAELHVPLIDLSRTSMALLQEFGPEKSRLLFNQLKPGEHPNYPKGVEDNTHFSELGARKMAQLVLADIRALNLELSNRIVKRSK